MIWGVLWRRNKISEEYLLTDIDCKPRMFRTRKECRLFIKKYYGYIKKRVDLRAEHHGWKVPMPVKLKVDWEK